MSRTILSIALCVSFLGMTVMPSGYIPCCCKGTRNSLGAHAGSLSPGRVEVKTEARTESKPAHHACCTMPKDAPQATCCGHGQVQATGCTGNALAGPCHNCRCIAEMQIVAIPGSALSEKSYRVSELTAPLTAVSIVTPVEPWVPVADECVAPGIVITLQTCSLRC